MNHREMREYFKAFSGRDNMADKEITALFDQAIDFLSPRIVGHFSKSFIFTSLQEGMNVLDFSSHYNAIDAIWVAKDDGSYDQLIAYFQFENFINDYNNRTGVGIPTAWVKNPPLSVVTTEQFQAYAIPGETYTTDMFDGTDRLLILFNMQAPMGGVNLRISGSQRINKLIDDDDFNILTVDNPTLLAQTALYFKEIRRRQYEEASFMLNQVNALIVSMDTASVMAEVAQMGDQING